MISIYLKKLPIYILSTILLLNPGCSGKMSDVSDIFKTEDGNPVIFINNPSGSSVNIDLTETLNVDVDASDSDGIIDRVEFYIDGVLVETDTSEPYNYLFANYAEGSYSLIVSAIDNDSNITNSSPITINVTSDPGPGSNVIIVDHRAIAEFDDIPESYITIIKRDINMYYAGTSHSQQIRTGLIELAEDLPNYSAQYSDTLPVDINSLTYTYDNAHYNMYWNNDGPARVIGILDANQAYNISMHVWCREMDNSYFTGAVLQRYLDQMESFKSHYNGRDIDFIYSTGNADSSGSDGYTRYQNNQQIRNWVMNNGSGTMVLFDFADIECWQYDQDGNASNYSTYTYNDTQVPVRHSLYDYDELLGHTNRANRVIKAKAMWWMFARLLGWN